LKGTKGAKKNFLSKEVHGKKCLSHGKIRLKHFVKKEKEKDSCH
jgi:hypothetical protein